VWTSKQMSITDQIISVRQMPKKNVEHNTV